MAEDKILKKLKEHDKRFDQIDKRLSGHDNSFKLLTKMVLDHDEQFVKLREENQKTKDEVLTAIDEVLVIVKRVDQERVFTFAAVQRIQGELEKQQNEIIKIKKVLQIS